MLFCKIKAFVFVTRRFAIRAAFFKTGAATRPLFCLLQNLLCPFFVNDNTTNFGASAKIPPSVRATSEKGFYLFRLFSGHVAFFNRKRSALGNVCGVGTKSPTFLITFASAGSGLILI